MQSPDQTIGGTVVHYKGGLPKVEEIAKQLTKVSLFAKPDDVLTVPPNTLATQKFMLNPTKMSQCHIVSKRKDPKFVPYEPYKACVKSICNQPKMIKRTQPSNCGKIEAFDKSETFSTNIDGDHEKCKKENQTLSNQLEKLRDQLNKIQTEMSNLNQQLSTQLQVNNELKKLLVASVGEDVQGRVQCLTEDKARMATMIRKYSERVDKDFEEKERMSIQCDMFRAKFMATSMMLEDHMQWKGIFTQKIEEAKEAMRVLLEERDVIHPLLVNVYQISRQIQTAFDPLHTESAPSAIPESSDNVSLSIATSLMIEGLKDRLLGTLGHSINNNACPMATETRTPGEKIALKLLEDCTQLVHFIKSSAYSKQFHLPLPFHSGRQFDPITMNCCGKCNGDIVVV